MKIKTDSVSQNRERTKLKMQNAGIKKIKRGGVPVKAVHPKGVEKSYYSKLYKLARILVSEVKESILPKLPDFYKSYNQEIGQYTDDYSGDIRRTIQNVSFRVAIVYNRNANSIASDIADQTEQFQKRQYEKQMYSVLGINPISEEPYLKPMMDAFVATNVDLITSIPTSYFTQLEGMIKSGIQQGVSMKDLQRDILDSVTFKPVERTKASKTGFRVINPVKRSRLIAIDQTNKFYGSLQKVRQSQAGISRYIWRTSKDERVRETHVAREGKVFTWEKGSEIGTHPGQEIQCRCIAEPIFDDF